MHRGNGIDFFFSLPKEEVRENQVCNFYAANLILVNLSSAGMSDLILPNNKMKKKIYIFEYY